MLMAGVISIKTLGWKKCSILPVYEKEWTFTDNIGQQHNNIEYKK